MELLPWYKKYLGYLIPLVVIQQSSAKHSKLKIKYFQGQWQLETKDALYSDGYRYAPFRLAFNELHGKDKLENISSFLLLGAGLGSALYRLQKVYQLYPATTLVEYDQEIIELSKEFFNLNKRENLRYINANAVDFLNSNNKPYDLIGVDLFEGLTNSDLLFNSAFIKLLANAMHSKSQLIINTIFDKKNICSDFEDLLEVYFVFKRLDRKPNYIYIAELK